MRVGYTCIFQGSGDAADDQKVYSDELALCDLAEPLGFEMLWGVEHHFTSYTMCPDPVQFLTYMAGRTENILLGSGAVILPWHDPVRVAEQVTMLDLMSNGRFIFGMGRGLGRIEFEGLRIPMDESRARFVESAEIVMRALQTGVLEADGEFYKIPRRDLRPRPTRTFDDRIYAAAVSPESVRIMADVGAGILINPQKDWTEVAEDMRAYREQFRELKGREAPAPMVTGWVCCHEDRRGRPGDGARVHRRLLPLGDVALRARRRPLREHARVRVLPAAREVHRRSRLAERVIEQLHRAPDLGHARRVLRADRRHPEEGRQRRLQRGLLVRRYDPGGRRGEHAPVRLRGDAAAQGAAVRSTSTQLDVRHGRSRRRTP